MTPTPIIGQECICPDGLGRVVAFSDRFPHIWIQVDTYVKNRSCQWAEHNVQLVAIGTGEIQRISADRPQQQRTQKTYQFIREVGPEEWHPLPHPFKAGDVVERASDQFGLCRDDFQYGNRETVPCREVSKPDFMFTIPVEFLVDNESGKPIMGDYIQVG